MKEAGSHFRARVSGVVCHPWFPAKWGIPNLIGGDGSTLFGTPNPIERDTLGTVIGTWVQMIGVLTALIATRNNYRKPTRHRR